MRTEQYAKELREKFQAIQKAQTEYIDHRASCKHSKVVILCSEYSGSYSYDYDDWHDEIRLCLVCGRQEAGSKQTPHKLLLNPIKRFEYNIYGRNTPFDQTVLANPHMFPLSTIMKFVKENGYNL